MGTDSATDHLVQVLERVPLFRGLPRGDLERVARIVRTLELAAGDFLFREGDPEDRFYVVDTGAVEILKERPLGDHERLVVRRGGDAFGEMALFNEVPRSASVRALEDTRLLALAREDFESLLGGESLSLRLLKGLSRNLWSLDGRFAASGPGAGGEVLRQFSDAVLRGLEPRSAPQVDGYRIAGAMAREESGGGGALWDAVAAGDGRTLLALMDVKGHGLPPAYLIAIVRAVLHEVAPAEDLPGLLGRLNAATVRSLFEGLDECMEAALVEVAEGGLRWSSAGDQRGVVIRADGGTEDAPSHGPPLGILPVFEYGVAEIGLNPGDTFLAMSDVPTGLMKGAVDLIRDRSGADPAELAQILSAVFRQQTRSETDVAFLVVRKT